MSSKLDYLSKYKTAPVNPFKPIKVKRKKIKNSNLVLIDENIDGFQNSDDEDPLMVQDQAYQFESKFKQQGGAEGGWDVVREGDEMVEDSARGRKSPSATPERRNRGSPSPSPVRSGRGRRSPSATPERRRRGSPSPSPARSGRGRRSPSASPKKRRRQSPSPTRSESEKAQDGIKMSNGTIAGLQSGRAIRDQMESRRESEKMEAPSGLGQQTVYRDKTGKKVDMEAQKAESIVLKKLEEAKQEAKMDWGSGLIQKEERLKKHEILLKEKTRGLATYADDLERNDEMKGKMRWGDTMASQLNKPERKNSRRVTYKGPQPTPNRYGIMPGFRWDGIDRGNGWELKVFQRKHLIEENRVEYQRWANEDL